MLLVATGLKREARILAAPHLTIIAGGGDRARLEKELEAAAGTAQAIISMGLCGALAEGLRPGDWVVGTRLVAPPQPANADGDEPILCDPQWSDAIARTLDARAGPMMACDGMIADAAQKRAAHAETGAIAVDMESHIAARVAHRRGLPFAIARVVSDAADRSLPKAAQAGMAIDGRMDVLAVLKALVRRPHELPALIEVGREAEVAFQALGRGRDLPRPGIGRFDLR
jgi:hopanoid-associated phosphorylase